MNNQITCCTIPENLSAAILVLSGYYGNGTERQKKLEADGYNYNTVQEYVNQLILLIERLG